MATVVGAAILAPTLYLAVFAAPKGHKLIWSVSVLSGLSLSLGASITGIMASLALEEELPDLAAVKAVNREVFVNSLATQAVAQMHPPELQDAQPGELPPIPEPAGIG